jgi:predicted dehydrogenase
MKILIIGIGSIAKKHIKAILSFDLNATIYAYRRTKPSSTVENVINIYSLDNFNENIDFIIISNPTSLHGKTILEVIKFKAPLFIEKPVLHNLKLEKLLKVELKKNNIISYIACNLRFHPAIQFIKKYLSTHEVKINEVNIYSGSDLTKWRPDDDYRKSYSSFSELGGGVHLDLIHEIDYCTWIFGYPIKINSFLASKSTLGIDSIDSARYILEYKKFNIGITLNYFRKDTKRDIEILTENETILVDLVKCKIYNKTSKKILFEQKYKIEDTYYNQILYFIKCIKNKNLPMNSFNEGIEILKIAINE